MFWKQISPQVYFGTYIEQKWSMINVTLFMIKIIQDLS